MGKMPVIDLKQLLNMLNNFSLEINKSVEAQLTPKEMKEMAMEALSLKNDRGLVYFQQLLDNIDKQAYNRGRLEIIDILKNIVDTELQRFENAKSND